MLYKQSELLEELLFRAQRATFASEVVQGVWQGGHTGAGLLVVWPARSLLKA